MAPIRYRFAALATLAALAALAGCGSGDTDAVPSTAESAASAPATGEAASAGRVAGLLERGEAVFGYFPRSPDAEQARSLAGNREIDFVMLSQEDELDVPALRSYVDAMNEASAQAGGEPIPVLVRIPSVSDAATAQENARQVIEAGASGIVFPHVATAQQAETSVQAMGERLWREGASGGDLVNIQIVEEQEGVGNASDIVDTPGLSVVFAGPGTLRQSYGGDMEAVENAIQTVLSACREHDVPCGITAGPDDIEQRLGEGFRVIIVYDTAALPVGRRAAGRTE